jgi:oligosaccharide repeat unit polymerase
MMRPNIREWSINRFNHFRFNRDDRSWIFHPLVLFSGVWIGVVILYSLHLSDLLLYTSTQTLAIASYLILPFLIVTLIFLTFFHFSRSAFGQSEMESTPNFELLTRRLRRGFIIWAVISCVEIVTSGGLPIVWLIQGSSKTYFDFGIPTVHGFMNSLLLAMALIHAALYGILKRKQYLLLPAFVILWSILAVTRNMMIVLIFEVSLVLLQLQRVRIRTIFRSVFGGTVVTLVFGFIGDLRTGGEAFRLLAQPTKNYPDWLPSGILWVYIYLVTPLNNLIYTAQGTQPLHSLLFPNTLSSLLPSVLRNMALGPETTVSASGDLVTAAFNVSTAYVGPFQDYGYAGMILFSSVIGLACMFFWKKTSLRDLLIYTVLAQCLLLTVFFNHFFYLPIISQILWLAIFFMPEVRFGKKEQTTDNLHAAASS